jgi:PadR family transcriptional regulator PadR
MDGDFFENWVTQLRKGMLELCILNAVGREPLYGYDIVKRLGEVDSLVISEGTVYPILSRLKREGLLDTRIEESQSGPPRKYYQLSAGGRRMLGEMNRYWGRVKQGIERLETEQKP